ncbi:MULTISPECIES: PPOX class F420-dependent oxidoreductase [Kribbella]|uniref:PPOX class probable F420-dependent enzyme n=1 Tax=Kribbella pratensis TaxID=2512112 RepID=A0ABY2FNT8_9ACTN|nr:MULTISPECIES: PPOX class F420-dependent oxidoreductase [Kribbella]TDW94602.1 PPOX class probable F420-dependent enzyme [Kribbella pratensis]TDX03192.1 PPOX class probable F420-dependent enzyme [Kribbella sp. VKM Ac-2566]
MTQTLLERIGTHGLGVLVTIKRDGRPQLSNITYVFDGDRVRISLTDGRAKTKNLRRDPRASLYVNGPNGRSYVVLEGKAELSPIAAEPYDAVVEDLVDYYRTASGEHPDWDEYRAVMVQDKRLMLSMTVDHAYGMPAPS